MTGVNLIVEQFENHPIAIRASDKYWNLTTMCKARGKRVNNFLRSDSTDGYLKSLTYRLNQQLVENSASEILFYYPGVSADAPKSVSHLVENSASFKPLVEVYKGGVPELQGTWGHQRVALRLAAWLDPDLDAWVYEVIEKLLTQGKVELKDEIAGLRQVLRKKEETLYELECEYAVLEYQSDRLKYELDEIQEVVTWRQLNSFSGRDC